MAKTVWIDDPVKMVTDMRLDEVLRQELVILMNQWTTVVESHMRSTAAWRDRTGALRGTLSAWVDQSDYMIIRLSWDYTMYYGWYLEFRTDLKDRFAIIHPTHDILAPRIIADVRKLVASL